MKNITPIILSSLFLLPGILPLRAVTLVNHPTTNPKSSTQISQNINPELEQLDEATQQIRTTVNRIAKDITVRINSANNGGSGVLIAKKGNTYLVLTNAHVTRRTTQLELQAPDGQKYTAKTIDGGFDRKYDLALLEFTSSKQYQLANLSNSGILKPNDRNIYSAGFPFDSQDLRISPGEVTQLSDIPFDNGTQIGYEIAKGEKGVRQGMSGGPIFDASGVFLGINTISAAPILPNYTYNDGSKPLAKLAAKYREANWGIPVYNFLVQVKPDILYGYKFKGLEVGKIQRQATLTGYMAKLNDAARKQTVRIENSGGNGSGVIVAREGNSYYVVTAKHVVENDSTQQKFTNNKLITYDQDTHELTSTVVATGVDLAVVKFSSNSNYPIAQLSEAIPNTDEIVLAGGFPGRKNINSPLWQWQLNPGYVFEREQGKVETQDKQSFENGYDIIYSSISHGGMSGGAVFDPAGRVIGIHGRAEQTNGTLLGNSQGISIQTLIGLAEKLQLNPKLLQIAKTPASTLTALDLKTIETAMQNLTKPNPEDDGERWLTYGNQLHRVRQYEESVIAFDTAITKGQILTGNYGKTLSLMGLGKLDLAQAAIAKAIEAVPSKNRADYYYFWKHQSLIFREQEKYAQALQSIDIAIKLEPQDRTLLNAKASILSKQKRYAAAIKIYDDLIREREEAYAYYNRGLVKLKLGDKKGEIFDYNRAIKINPNFAYAYYNRGNAKAELGDKQEAILDYNRAIKINSNFAYAYINRGNNKSRLGDNQGAISDHNRAIEINPNYATAYYNRGLVKSKLGDKQGAISDYDRAIEINSNYTDAYYNRGLIKSKLGDQQGAISDYDWVIKINSNDANAYYTRGAAKAQLGDKQGAISDYNRGIEIKPNDANAYYNRGLIKSELGDQQGAISDYDLAIKINPNDAYVCYNRGLVKSELGDKQGAISDYNLAIKIDPNFAEAYTNRGNKKSELGDKQGAISDYDRAIEIKPNYAEAYTNRGVVKWELGDKQGAISDYDRAIEIKPNFAEAYYNRGIDKSRLGDKQGAISDLSKSAELFRQQGRMDLYQKVREAIAQYSI